MVRFYFGAGGVYPWREPKPFKPEPSSAPQLHYRCSAIVILKPPERRAQIFEIRRPAAFLLRPRGYDSATDRPACAKLSKGRLERCQQHACCALLSHFAHVHAKYCPGRLVSIVNMSSFLTPFLMCGSVHFIDRTFR